MSNGNNQALDSANEANAERDNNELGATEEPCPLTNNEPDWIELTAVDPEGNVIESAEYGLKLPDDDRDLIQQNGEGIARKESIKKGDKDLVVGRIFADELWTWVSIE